MLEVAGNSFLYCLFRSCTLMLLVVGLGNISAGISVCVQADNFMWYNGGYIFLGFFLVMLAIFGHTTRTALGGLTFYLVCLGRLFASPNWLSHGPILSATSFFRNFHFTEKNCVSTFFWTGEKTFLMRYKNTKHPVLMGNKKSRLTLRQTGIFEPIN